jgi:hypothetical protein
MNFSPLKMQSPQANDPFTVFVPKVRAFLLEKPKLRSVLLRIFILGGEGMQFLLAWCLKIRTK